jgi:hypothetical protein
MSQKLDFTGGKNTFFAVEDKASRLEPLEDRPDVQEMLFPRGAADQAIINKGESRLHA